MHAAKAAVPAALVTMLVAAGWARSAVVIGWGDPGHSTTGTWNVNNTGWNLGEHWEATPDSGSTSTWEFTGLAAGDYYVAASWTPVGNRSTTAQYDVSDGGGSVAVDQQLPLSPFNADGFGWWNQLSGTPVSVVDGTLSVTLSDTDPALFIMADAVRISTEPLQPNVFYLDSNSPAGYSATGTWNRESGGALGASGNSPIFAGDEWWQADPAAADTATWSFTGLAEGDYRVSTTWFPGGNRTTDAVFNLSDGGGAVNVNQQVLTTDLNDGTPWQDLNAELWVADGTLEVTLSDNDPAGYLIHDAVRVELLPALLIWDGLGDGNWADVPGWETRVGDPAGTFPDASARARIDGNTVTVAQDRQAASVQVTGGMLEIAGSRTLTVAGEVDVDSGVSLSLGAGATLVAGRGGSIASLDTAAGATVNTGGAMAVETLSAAAGTFTKQGPGTLSLDNASGTGVSAAGATLRIEEGTLRSVGSDPLGGATEVEFAGGVLVLQQGGPPAGADAYYTYESPLDPGNDDSGNGHTGVLTNAAWSGGGVIGGALAIPVAAATMVASPPVDIGDDWTIASWYKGLKGDGIYRTLTRGANDHQVLVDPAGNLGVWDNATATAFHDSGFDMAGLDNGVWHHILAIGSGTDTNFYIDGTHVGTSDYKSTGDVIGIGNIQTTGQPFADVIDETLVYNRVLGPAEISALVDAGLAGGYGGPLSLTDTNFTVSADSAIVAAAHSAAFGTLTLQGGLITTAGAGGGITFTGGTTIDPVGTPPFTVGFDVAVPTDVGVIDVLNTVDPITLVKSGPADFVLTDANLGQNAFSDNVTFDVRQGRLTGLHGSNPFGTAALQLGGGELVLASAAAGGDVTYDNRVSVVGDATLTAGTGGLPGANPGPLTVTIGSPGQDLPLGNATLMLGSTDQYVLNVAAGVSGDATLRVDEGHARLSGGADVDSLYVTGGILEAAVSSSADQIEVTGGEIRLSGQAELTAVGVLVTGGTIDTGGNDLVVSESLRLNKTVFRIDAGNTMAMSGPDLADEVADRSLTISGGVLRLTRSALPAGAVGVWKFDEGAGDTAADSSGVPAPADAQLVGPEWVTDDPDRGTAIRYDGQDDYVAVPDFALTTNTITFAAWLGGDQTGDWSGIMTSRVANGGTSDAFMGYGPVADHNLHYVWNDNSPATYGWNGGPQIPANQWAFVAVAIDPTKITAYVWSDGTLQIGENVIPHIPQTVDALEFGRDYPFPTRYYQGMMDDVYMFDRALTAEEVTDLLTALGGPLQMAATHLEVTATSTVEVDAAGDVVLGNVALSDDVRLTLGGAASFNVGDLRAGSDAALEGNLLVRGELSAVDDGPGVLSVTGSVEFGDEMVYDVHLAEWDSDNVPDPWNPIPPTGPVNDKIDVAQGDVFLAGALRLTAVARLSPPHQVPGQPGVMIEWYGDQTRTIAAAAGESSIRFNFAEVPDAQPEVYDLPGTGNWGQGHLGQGVFLTRHSGDDPVVHPGVTYGLGTTEVHVFQAADGDTNGDRRLGSLDIQAILSANTFPDVQPADWPQGDFTGDGWCNGLDIQAILATGLYPFLPDPYAAVDPGDQGHRAVDLLMYASDYAGPDYPPGEAGTLRISSNGVAINGYVIRSAAGIFNGGPAENLGWFAQDTDRQISGNMGFTLDGDHLLGDVIGDQGPAVNPLDDLTFTYTIHGAPGIFTGRLIVVPEPGTLVMLIAGAAVLLLWRRRSRA